MKISRLTILYFTLICLCILCFSYYTYLIILPKVIHTSFITNKIEQIINSKSNIQIKTQNLSLNSYPNLTAIFYADRIYLSDKNNNELLNAKNISLKLDLKQLSITNLNIDYIYINEADFKNLIKSNRNKKTSSFKLKNIPALNINKAEIWVDKKDLSSIFLTLSNIHIINHYNNNTYCTFEMEIVSQLLKNLVNIGKHGYLYIKDDSLYAKNLEVLIGVSKLYIDGKIINDNNKIDFNLTGENIPIKDFESSLLYFLKLKKPGKQFIENFYDFSGEMDINLNINENGIFGLCNAKNLKAFTSLFKIPLYFKNAVFKFNERTITSETNGLLGNETVFSSFKLNNLALDNQEVTGHIHSKLSDKIADKYIPDTTIIGFADTYVDYKVKNKKINVDYKLIIPVGSDIIYKNAYLGLRDKTKQLLVNTIKENNFLKVSHYDYSTIDNGIINNIILGNALFIKTKNHYLPEFITAKTNGFAPVSVTGSFGKYIDGGIFNGNLKYNFNKSILTGNFIVKDSEYKNFYVEEASIQADTSNMNIDAKGTYEDSQFECKINAQNDFKTTNIHIYNMDLFINEYIIKNKNSNTVKLNKIKIPQKAKDIDLTIDLWKIRLNKIKHKKIEIKDILLSGYLKNDIFSFTMPAIIFADGLVDAKGKYNMKNHSSVIDFSAKNINSNTAAYLLFNLKDQISGTANASLHAQTIDKLQDIKAEAHFSVENGYLPKIGSTQFILKKSKKIKRPIKFKISDIINIDLKNMKALSSNINGYFNIDNNELKNIKITSKQKYLSLLIEGDYDVKSQNADLNIFGKYNKNAERKIKILFIPLSWITKILFKPEYTKEIYKNKLKEVPSIHACEEEENAIRVKINGDLDNTNNLKIELKSII